MTRRDLSWAGSGPRARYFAAAAAACVFAATAGADRQTDLEALRAAIGGRRERVAAYELEQRGLLETVEALDRAVAALASDLKDVRRRADTARATLETVEAETRELRRRAAETRHAMSRRAVALYKAGDLGAVRLVFASEGIRDLLWRASTLQLLLRRDAELLERHRVESAALVDVEARAILALEGRDEALAALRERTGQLAAERRAKRQVVARLHRDRARERAALVELENAAQALEETVSSLDRAPMPGAPLAGPRFASLRGRLQPPVAAPISQSFGRVVDAEFHTETFRKGVEFDAAPGTPVTAVANGRVRFAGWFRGYGRLVILDHGDQYFTVSGHLAEIAVEVGDAVRPGGVIGTVGDTGSLAGPRLYFEIRHGGEPQDPSGWLGASQKG